MTAPLVNSSAHVAVTAAEGNIGSCFLRALLFPHMPPSQFPVIIPTERQVGRLGRKSFECEVIRVQNLILWQFGAELVMGNERVLYKIVERWQRKDNNKRERRSGGQRQRGKSKRVKLHNLIFQFSWQPAGTTQSNSSQVKSQRSHIT